MRPKYKRSRPRRTEMRRVQIVLPDELIVYATLAAREAGVTRARWIRELLERGARR